MQSTEEKLAPPPDFRYVGLEPVAASRAGMWASIGGAAAGISAGLAQGFGLRHVFLAAMLGSAAALVARKVGGARVRGAPMAIVPWGVLIDPDERPRVLRWAAVRKVHVEMTHGRDEGTPTTSCSFVTVETDRDKWTGRAAGTVPLDRLLAHLDAYAKEQSHSIALDLEGCRAGEGPLEPECEPLISAARGYLESAPASTRLGLPPGGYRRASVRAAGPDTLAELRAVLTDRTSHEADPRAFAAVVAAELEAKELADDLVALIQCPHPVIAAVARQAALKLGVDPTKAGSLAEVAPFLMPQDAEHLAAWGPAGASVTTP